MAECICLPKCPFFNDTMAGMPTTAEMMKKRYCLGDNSKCARYMVFNKLGSERVPANLYPTQIDRAEKLIGVGG